mmetsp:Transcript_92788/g.262439  ORF Transcript_92788/g.262439 Transcript_92788/m.262439 type:complete len:174 (-) Transcript_92788:306-827(-)
MHDGGRGRVGYSGARGRSPVPRVDCSSPSAAEGVFRAPVPKRLAASPQRGRRESPHEQGQSEHYAASAIRRSTLQQDRPQCGRGCGFMNLCGMETHMSEPEEIWSERTPEQYGFPLSEPRRPPHWAGRRDRATDEGAPPLSVDMPSSGGPSPSIPARARTKDRKCTISVDDCL